MIVPITSEESWLPLLAGLIPWQPPMQRIVLVAPHPDDETLAAGGFIAAQRQAGVEVIVVAATDGENAYGEGHAGLREQRRQEQTLALAHLGVPRASIVRFEMTDSGLHEKKQELLARLMPFVSADTHLVAPWIGDFHPDHEACGWAAEEAARLTGAVLTSYFFWTWHRGMPALLDGIKLRSFPLTETLLATKLEALSCHHSQLFQESGEPILPDHLLAPARRCFEVFSIA